MPDEETAPAPAPPLPASASKSLRLGRRDHAGHHAARRRRRHAAPLLRPLDVVGVVVPGVEERDLSVGADAAVREELAAEGRPRDAVRGRRPLAAVLWVGKGSTLQIEHAEVVERAALVPGDEARAHAVRVPRIGHAAGGAAEDEEARADGRRRVAKARLGARAVPRQVADVGPAHRGDVERDDLVDGGARRRRRRTRPSPSRWSSR